MAVNTVELRQKRAALIKDAREILNKVEVEKRTISQEEKNKYDLIMTDVDALMSTIAAEERTSTLENDLKTSVNSPLKPVPESQDKRKKFNETEEYREAFDKILRRGKSFLENEDIRSLSLGTDTEGGYLVSQEYETSIIEQLSNATVMRDLATIINTSNDRNIPVDETEGTANWDGEGAAATESDEVFGKIVLGAFKVQTLMKVSEELLQDSAFDLAAFIAKKYAKRIGAKQDEGFINGNGAGKPQGVIPAGTVGVTTASASAITSDEIIDLFYSLSAPYRKNATWLFNDSTAKVLRKLKNGTTGDYMWMPGLQSGEPDTLLGRPVKSSDSVPAIAASAKVGCIGDMSYYWIAQRGGRVIQRLSELYAANGQVGFRGFERVDGRLTLSSAVKVMAMHA